MVKQANCLWHEKTRLHGADGFSFASHQLIGKPNQNIPELLSTLIGRMKK